MDVSQRLGVTKLSGTNYYEIELDTTSNFNSPMKQTLDANTYYSSYDYYYTTVGNLLYGTKYYWRARCAHAADTSGWSAVRNFTTRAVPQLYTPSDNSTNMAVTQRLGVTKVSGTTYYEIELDTTSNFNSPMKQTLNADTYYSSYDYYYTTVSNLLYGTKYYWRARCAHAADTSGWSVVWNFTTGARPLLYSPNNNTTNMAVTQRLCVQQFTGSNYYEIELDTTSNFDSPMKQTLNADTYYSSYSYYYTTVSNLLYGTKYYWRARCAHAADTTDWSAVWDFTTGARPLLYSPNNNTTNMAVTQRLCVQQFTGSNYYEIELDTTSNFDSPMKQTLNADTYYSSYSYYYTTVSNLLYGTKYYWRARCAHAADTTDWSAVWDFTTGARPLLYSPNNNTTNISITQRLCVQQFTGSNYYEIELDTTSNFDSPLKQTLNASSYNSSYSYYYTSVSNLLYGTKYYWRARCAHAADTSGWSAVWNFTTQFTLTTAPTLISPVNGATNIDAQNVTLTWNEIANATSYQYQVSTTSDFSNLVASGTTANPYVFVALPGNITCYWRVRGSDGLGFSPWSVIWHFSTIINCDDPVYTDQYATDCYSYSWHGETYTETGVYYDTLSTFLGCDSIVALHLTISQSITSTISINVCESDLPYHYVNGNIDTTFEVGTPQLSTFNFQFLTSHGCDSIVTLDLTINTPTEGDLTATACGSFNWLGQLLTESGDYTDVLTNAAGCDSTVTLHLTINTPTEGDTSAVACGSFNWHGQNLTESGDYTDVLTNAMGCDSIVTLHLTVYPVVTEPVEVTVCERDLPYHYVNGNIDTTFEVGTPQLSTFNFQFLTQYGCDSIVALHLTIYSTVTELVEVTICENDLPYHYVNGDIDTIFEVGTPQLSTFNFQFLTSHGCDSIVTLDLTINTPTEGDLTATACGSFNWLGQLLTESGDYTDVLTNAAGCDSTVTLHLTINTPTEGDTSAVACGSFNWHGQNLTESGDYTDVLTNAMGCDSIVTLHLTVYPTVTELVEVTICENDLPYHYVNGDIDTTFEVGTPQLSTFNFQLSTQYGCDSIVSLTLIVNASDTDSTRIVDLDLGGRIRLYPNPTLGKVWIDVQNGVEIQQISIFDLAGREVKVPSLSVQSHSEIDLTDCVRGIYMVRIVTNEGILVRKITRM